MLGMVVAFVIAFAATVDAQTVRPTPTAMTSSSNPCRDRQAFQGWW